MQNNKHGKKTNRKTDIIFNLQREREKPKEKMNLHNLFVDKSRVQWTQSGFAKLSFLGVLTFLS